MKWHGFSLGVLSFFTLSVIILATTALHENGSTLWHTRQGHPIYLWHIRSNTNLVFGSVAVFLVWYFTSKSFPQHPLLLLFKFCKCRDILSPFYSPILSTLSFLFVIICSIILLFLSFSHASDIPTMYVLRCSQFWNFCSFTLCLTLSNSTLPLA